MENEIVTVPCQQTGSVVTETQTMTVSHTSTRTVIVTRTPSSAVISESSESMESQYVWTVVAIIFIITTVLGATLSVILGCLLYKRNQMMQELNICSSDKDLSKPHPDGEPKTAYETLDS